MNLTREYSKALSYNNDLYANIAYPLAATLCHDDNHPRATIAEHLSDLKAKIATAQDELRALGLKWDACQQEERDAWSAATGDARTTQQASYQSDAEVSRAMAAFQDEAEEIVSEKCQILEDIEKVCLAVSGYMVFID